MRNIDYDRTPTVEIPCLGVDHSPVFNANPSRFPLETMYMRDDVTTIVCRCPDCLTTLVVEAS